MVIKSPFKDYYDYVANRYGGGDPRIVYVRGRLGLPEKDEGPNYKVRVLTEHAPSGPSYYKREKPYHPDQKKWALLVVAGKMYLLSKKLDNTEWPDDVNNYRLEPLVDPDEEKTPWWRRNRYIMEFDKEYSQLVKLCQDIGHPVFVIDDVQFGNKAGESKVILYPQCPNLGQIGMASLIRPEQMYQDLAYFVGNLMKKSPDVKPPVELSNKQKIIKAGFDLVKSFRHRKS